MVAEDPYRFVEALERLSRIAGPSHEPSTTSAKARLLGGGLCADVRAVGPSRRGRTLAVALDLVDAPGAIDWLELAVERYDVALTSPGFLDGEEVAHRAELRARGLSAHALGRIRFVAHKPPADVYVDRRALRFDGAFGDVAFLRAIMSRRQ
ncbi:MAG: hypothetical protein R3B82_10565 [Sandaracinaceae bacterium]